MPKETNLNNKIDNIKSQDLSEIKYEFYNYLQKNKNETEQVILNIKNELKYLGDKQNILYENLNASMPIPTRLRL